MSSNNANNAGTYMIAGYTINFPYIPYSCQLLFMEKLLKTLKQSNYKINCNRLKKQQTKSKQSQLYNQDDELLEYENELKLNNGNGNNIIAESSSALLESPTGTGKSLALLCSVLAWQIEDKKQTKERQQQLEREWALIMQADNNNYKLNNNNRKHKLNENDVEYLSQDQALLALDPIIDDEDNTLEEQALRNNPFYNTNTDINTNNKPPNDNNTKQINTINNEPNKSSLKCPTLEPSRIYFASRTHSQLTQLIAALNKTAYRPNMAILGSRNQLCINKSIADSENRNEDCEKLLEFNECSYFHNQSRLKAKMQSIPVFDIEDLIEKGKKVRGCPYFTSRSILNDAEIVFLPYNYILDPNIRSSLNIKLENSVIIMDESHNAEDIARSATSKTFYLHSIKITVVELVRLKQIYENTVNNINMDNITNNNRNKKLNPNSIEHNRLIAFTNVLNVIQLLYNWFNGLDINNSSYNNDNNKYLLYNGDEIIQLLQSIGINNDNISKLKRYVNEACVNPANLLNELHKQNSGDKAREEPHLNAIATGTLQSLFLVFTLILSKNLKYSRDYKLVIQYQSYNNNNNSNKQHYNKDKPDIEINFWCLNPSVAFDLINSNARSLILCSGTLSPMDSFSSELGIKFPNRLCANHIISHSQVLFQIINRYISINNNNANTFTSLNASYTSLYNNRVMDAYGYTILQLISNIPGGVLVFFPSYGALDKLTQRWKQTEIFKQIESVKKVVLEPKGTNTAKLFNKLMDTYHNTNNDYNNNPTKSRLTGALCLGVVRGKLSEGIDFTDHHCRAVIIIGIPYPNSKDLEIILKKQHNDQTRKLLCNNHILTSTQWYQTQAYRAINQAIGRVIRHKNDYGAIILIDERYAQPNSNNPSDQILSQLSKWVKNAAEANQQTQPISVNQAEYALKRFFAVHNIVKPEPKPSNQPTYISIPQLSNNDSNSNNVQSANPKFENEVKATEGDNQSKLKDEHEISDEDIPSSMSTDELLNEIPNESKVVNDFASDNQDKTTGINESNNNKATIDLSSLLTPPESINNNNPNNPSFDLDMPKLEPPTPISDKTSISFSNNSNNSSAIIQSSSNSDKDKENQFLSLTTSSSKKRIRSIRDSQSDYPSISASIIDNTSKPSLTPFKEITTQSNNNNDTPNTTSTKKKISIRSLTGSLVSDNNLVQPINNENNNSTKVKKINSILGYDSDEDFVKPLNPATGNNNYTNTNIRLPPFKPKSSVKPHKSILASKQTNSSSIKHIEIDISDD